MRRARRWPRHRRRRRTTDELAREKWFWLVQQLYKYIDVTQQNFFRDSTAGTPWYPRDMFANFTAGRAFRIALIDGLVLYPMAVRTDISELLDAIAQARGSIITRGQFWWNAIAPGAQGDFLTAQGPDAEPQWVNQRRGLVLSRVTKNGNQFVADGTTAKLVSWTVNTDELLAWDAPNNRYVVPATYPAVIVGLNIDCTGGGAMAQLHAEIRINGATLVAVNVHTDGRLRQSLSTGPILVTPGDVFEAYVIFQFSRTISGTSTTAFTMMMVREA